ncbi:putative ABC transporter permease [Paraeggerthella sp.]
MASVIIFSALMVVLVVTAVLFVFLGYRLIRNRREHAAAAANTLVALTVLSIIGTMMLFGLSAHHIGYLIQLVILIAVTAYLDPQLVEERRLQHKLKKMDKEQRAQERKVARQRKPKKGFITLNFFNLFWIFVVCCILGLVIETIYHFILFHEYQDRAGMLFGPFSPIYGFGALLMTIALNRFHDKPIWVVFLVSAVIGGAFEFFTSWIMEFAFGIRAWDYTGSFLSIDGRTNFVFMVMWGVLGMAWIKLLLPQLLKLINMIPWNWRYGVTAVCAALMLVDGIMSIQSIDCWYQRMAGKAPETPIEQFYAKHFDNEYMQNRFQTMDMNVEDSARADV